MFLDSLCLSITVSFGPRASFHPFVCLCVTISVSFCACHCLSVSLCVSVSFSLLFLSVSVSVFPSVGAILGPPSPPASGPYSLRTAPVRQEAAQTGPRALLAMRAGPGSGFQTLPVPPRVLVLLLYLQPPRVFVSPALTRPLCLSPEAPAPPHPHLPLHIPWAARGS